MPEAIKARYIKGIIFMIFILFLTLPVFAESDYGYIVKYKTQIYYGQECYTRNFVNNNDWNFSDGDNCKSIYRIEEQIKFFDTLEEAMKFKEQQSQYYFTEDEIEIYRVEKIEE